MALRVALLTWEYPPRVVGDLATYVQRLVAELARRQHAVTVVTFNEGPQLQEENHPHARIYRVPNPVAPHTNIVTWALSLTAEFQRVLANLCYDHGPSFDVLDAHEWQCVPAAAGLKRAFGIPFVYTAHSLEEQRASDPSAPLNSSIRGLEWLGSYEATAVVTPSDRVSGDLQRVHSVPPTKIHVVRPQTETWVDDTLRAYRTSVRG